MANASVSFSSKPDTISDLVLSATQETKIDHFLEDYYEERFEDDDPDGAEEDDY